MEGRYHLDRWLTALASQAIRGYVRLSAPILVATGAQR
jgi:hypothetical protein